VRGSRGLVQVGEMSVPVKMLQEVQQEDVVERAQVFQGPGGGP